MVFNAFIFLLQNVSTHFEIYLSFYETYYYNFKQICFLSLNLSAKYKISPHFQFYLPFYEIYYKDFDFDLKFNHSLLMFKI